MSHLTEEMPISEEALQEEPAFDDMPIESDDGIPENTDWEDDSAETVEEQGTSDREKTLPDYEKMAEEDLATIRALSPAMRHLSDLTELPNFARFATLREAGLSVEEALWAACHKTIGSYLYDNRSHLRSSAPRGARGASHAMTPEEMAAARDLFGDLTDGQIRALYAKCRN